MMMLAAILLIVVGNQVRHEISISRQLIVNLCVYRFAPEIVAKRT
jgi:hypothetical protein